MTQAERERLMDILWLILPSGSRHPKRLEWIVTAIESGRFAPSKKDGT